MSCNILENITQTSLHKTLPQKCSNPSGGNPPGRVSKTQQGCYSTAGGVAVKIWEHLCAIECCIVLCCHSLWSLDSVYTDGGELNPSQFYILWSLCCAVKTEEKSTMNLPHQPLLSKLNWCLEQWKGNISHSSLVLVGPMQLPALTNTRKRSSYIFHYCHLACLKTLYSRLCCYTEYRHRLNITIGCLTPTAAGSHSYLLVWLILRVMHSYERCWVAFLEWRASLGKY